MEGVIFDLRKFSIHDGPGIRTTVFFKGCPMGCWWCHNPEGMHKQQEIMINPARCIKECQECLNICNSISKKEKISIDKKTCNLCGKCALACPAEAIEMVGKNVSVKDVMDKIEEDKVFYEVSGGGATFSGGEPLMQPDFLKALLSNCKEKGIHTALDTSGYAPYAPYSIIESMMGNVDLFLYDLKVMDDGMHRKYTGVSNALILRNLAELSKAHKNIEIRFPLIPLITDTDENVKQVLEFLTKLGIRRISLLPFHVIGYKKYERLGLENRMLVAPSISQEKVEKIKTFFEKNKFMVTIGG